MAILLWIFVPGFTAAGAALLICFMMRCRMDEAIARERGALAELQSALVVQREALESAIWNAKAEAKRAAFDEFLNDFRVEQRQYVRNTLLPKWQQMPQDRRQVINRHLAMLRNMSPATQEAALNDPRFLRNLSPDEQSMLRELNSLRNPPPQ